MEISVEYNSDFRHDLKVGKLKGETAFHKMIEDKKIEVKYDRKTKETLNATKVMRDTEYARAKKKASMDQNKIQLIL